MSEPRHRITADLATLRFPADPSISVGFRQRMRAETAVVVILALVPSTWTIWELATNRSGGANLPLVALLSAAALFLWGIAYVLSRIVPFCVEKGVMTLSHPVYLGPGRRVRTIMLNEIEHVEGDPQKSDSSLFRVTLIDSSYFWISSAGLGPGGKEFLQSLAATLSSRSL